MIERDARHMRKAAAHKAHCWPTKLLGIERTHGVLVSEGVIVLQLVSVGLPWSVPSSKSVKNGGVRCHMELGPQGHPQWALVCLLSQTKFI